MANIAVGAITAGLLADRPAAGTKGRLFFATDTKSVYTDTGAAWTLVASDAGGTGGTGIDDMRVLTYVTGLGG